MRVFLPSYVRSWSLQAFLLTCLMVWSMTSVRAQHQGDVWAFGGGVLIDFTTGTPVVGSSANPASYGCATMSDNLGDLLFYTDGVQVWNKNHVQMPNGSALSGFGGLQSSVIVPQPGSSTKYYIFTQNWGFSTNWSWYYSEVDMSLAGGLGDVVLLTKNTFISGNMHAQQCVVRHSNNQDWWVIGHAALSSTFHALPVTSTGVGSPVFSTSGTPMNSNLWGNGTLESNVAGDRLVAVTNSLASSFQLFDFDQNTGAVSNALSPVPGYWLGNFFLVDAAFSPDGTKLYTTQGWVCSIWPQIHNIFQYDLTIGTAAAIAASKVGLDSSTCPFELKLAPDNKIYISRYDNNLASDHLSIINNPNAAGTACNYVANGVVLGNVNLSTSVYSLPATLQFPATNFMMADSCFEDTANFSPIGPTPDSVIWVFGDTASGPFNTSTALNPWHVFSDSGTFTITYISFRLGNNGGVISDTIVRDIFVHPPPFVALGNDTALCAGEVLTLNTAFPGSTYLWQDGTTDSVMMTSISDQYWVEVTNLCGQHSDSITVDYDNNLTLELGSDTVVCPGVTFLLDPLTGASLTTSHLWQNGAEDSTQAVSQPGEYWLMTTNLCGTFADTVEVEYEAVPVTDLGDDLHLCTGDSAHFSAPFSRATYAWSTGSTSASISVGVGGLFQVTVTNLCGSASDEVEVLMDFPLVVELGEDQFTCVGETIELDATASNAPSYQWNTGATTPTLSVFAKGHYSVTISNICGNFEDRVFINFKPVPAVDVGADTALCEGEVLELAAPQSTFNHLWQDGSESATFLVKIPGTYWLEAGNECGETRDSIWIEYKGLPQIFLGKDTVVCTSRGELLLNAQAPDIASYQWQDGSTDSIYRVRAPDNYWVVVTDIWGCSSKEEILVGRCPVTLFIPNSFTPNGDGINDYFRAVGDIVIEFKMRIYNRWGELIFISDDFEEGWDGTSHGVKAPIGQYTCRIDYRGEKSGWEQLIERISLIR